MGNACAPADGVDEESAFAVRCTVSCTPSGRGGDDADDADDVMHFMPAPGPDDNATHFARTRHHRARIQMVAKGSLRKQTRFCFS